MLIPISTNQARKMIEEALGVQRVSLNGVRLFFRCVEGIDAKGEPKFWEQFREIKPDFLPNKQ